MDLLVFGLLNIALLIVGFIVISRRIERQFGSQAFLGKVESEANTIITELNATTERNIRILEDTINQLQSTIDQAELARKKLSDTTAVRSPKPVAEIPARPAAEPRPPVVELPNLPKPIAKPDEDTNPQAYILRLHQQGYDSETIAKRVGRTVGEVELIIRLSGVS